MPSSPSKWCLSRGGPLGLARPTPRDDACVAFVVDRTLGLASWGSKPYLSPVRGSTLRHASVRRSNDRAGQVRCVRGGFEAQVAPQSHHVARSATTWAADGAAIPRVAMRSPP